MQIAGIYKKEVTKVYQLAHIVNTVLFRAKGENVDMSPMKLQKMLFFIYTEYYAMTHTPLFSERFEPWKYGPVISDVYYTYANRKTPYIEKYMVDAEGELQKVALGSDPKLDMAFNLAWVRYKGYTGKELSAITHRENCAWWKAASGGQPFLNDNDIANDHRVGAYL